MGHPPAARRDDRGSPPHGPEATVASGALFRAHPSASWPAAIRVPGSAAAGWRQQEGEPIFPLLVKLIDGQADLSIQVHPDDRAAAAAGLGTGKTEAYHILAAEPGSIIYLGLDPEVTPEEFAASCLRANGSAAGCLRQVPAAPGMTVLIPAGTPHALGAGVLLYEIQQPSNVTFRLDDWGRVDAAGSGARAAPSRGTGSRRSAFAARTDPACSARRCRGGSRAPGGNALFRPGADRPRRG